MVEKNRTSQEYRYEIDALKLDLDLKKTNLQLNLANQENSSMIFIALLVGVAMPIFLTYGLLYFLFAAIIFFLIWLIPSIKRRKFIDKDINKIFCIFSEIWQTYEKGLGVNIKQLKKILKKRMKEAPEKIKEFEKGR